MAAVDGPPQIHGCQPVVVVGVEDLKHPLQLLLDVGSHRQTIDHENGLAAGIVQFVFLFEEFAVEIGEIVGGYIETLFEQKAKKLGSC
jgi:hypothetical protein